jgi:MFS family permease
MHRFHRRLFFFIGLFLISLGVFLTGPSELLGINPDPIWIFFTGYAINALGCVLVAIPSMPEIMDGYRAKYNFYKADNRLNDRSAGLFAMSLSFGAIIGPLASGALDYAIGYRYTNDCMAILVLVYFFVYIFNLDR